MGHNHPRTTGLIVPRKARHAVPKGFKHLHRTRNECRVIHHRKLTTVALQEWFNSHHPRLAPKTIRSMHGALRSTLHQAVTWRMIDRNPAIGIKLPRKKARKPPVLLELPQIRAM